MGGRSVAKTFRTRTQAERYLARTQAEIDLGTYAPPTARKLTFDELAALATADYKMNGRRSLDRLEDAITHLRGYFGAMRAATITQDRIVAYIAERQAAGYANATVYKEVAALRRMFRLALAARRVTPAQVPNFPRLTLDNVRTGFVTAAEFGALRAALDADVGPMIEFMYITGWRKSEAMGLTWDRVDEEGGVVRLDVGTTKSGRGRVFPFAAFPALAGLLKAQRARIEAAQRHTGQIILWVFHRDGRPIRDFGDAWRKACARAGLPGLVPHDLRRSAVRNLVRAGVPEKTAMALTGHKTRAIFDRYDIVDEQDLADGVARLAAFARSQRPGAVRQRRVVPLR